MRTTTEHATLTDYRERRFVALLLLELNAALHNTAQARQHGLLLPGVSGHQYFKLLLHQIQALRVVPQTIFQQDQVDRYYRITSAKESAGTVANKRR
jgi:hypothetical protein